MFTWLRPKKRPLTLGEEGEKVAARFLRRQGYAILAQNMWLGRYEIDILAREGDTVAFVEVRSRRGRHAPPPEDSIRTEKQQRLRKAAAYYLSKHGQEGRYYRFDVVSIIFPETGKPIIRLYRDAF